MFMQHIMNFERNFKIEMVKPLVFKIYSKLSKETFEVINYITDWHCKCPEHIETSSECKHIKLIKSWLGFKKNSRIAQESKFKCDKFEYNLDNNNLIKPLPTHPPPDPNESLGKWIEKIGNTNLIEFNIIMDYIMNYIDKIGFEKTLHLLTRCPIDKIIDLENEFKDGFWKNRKECPIKGCKYISHNKTNIIYHLATRHHLEGK
ncbi:MAG: hypothetical protein CEE43_13795 [Promethearchaeota archaeon Loki_b32]|nr:MAG: hypothetical protein CEE43_13795 [Candidatus Lokiarchaeota archaeon Loki_b32]